MRFRPARRMLQRGATEWVSAEASELVINKQLIMFFALHRISLEINQNVISM